MTVIKTGCNWAANKIQSSDPEPTFIGGATRTRHRILKNFIKKIYKTNFILLHNFKYFKYLKSGNVTEKNNIGQKWKGWAHQANETITQMWKNINILFYI
jgi:hypothetical protein